MGLQNFVIEVIQAIGGEVELLEYSLCYAMIPEEYSYIFNGKTEILLAFDFEVAEENPESEFVTFGSFVLDKIMNIASIKAISTVRCIIADNISLSKAEEKIKRYFGIDRGTMKILDEQGVMGRWICFNYRVGYTSEERLEELRDVWINLQNGEVDNEIRENKNSLYIENNPQYNYKLPFQVDTIKAFEKAYEEINVITKESSSKVINRLEFNREITRIDEYYDEIEKENLKLMQRKGITEKRKSELLEKCDSYKLEREKQKSEMINKYTVDVDISLDYGVVYIIPLIEYDVEIISRGNKDTKKVYYNPVLKCFCED
ncbi:MAG: hypothetical protein ACREVX_03325 [Clostridium sp.]|uniref:hypothetical protein n=1 Tax=Clostridium sp. TaxID=1506 RepID=UPI003D6CE287